MSAKGPCKCRAALAATSAAARAGALGEDPQEFKRMLDSFAIDLIADHVESEPMLLELLDMHLDYGQGYLFGEPRIARAETSAIH